MRNAPAMGRFLHFYEGGDSECVINYLSIIIKGKYVQSMTRVLTVSYTHLDVYKRQGYL